MTGGLAAGPGAGWLVVAAGARGSRRGRAGRVPSSPAPLRIPQLVFYAKQDVFDLCDTLARAERALIRAGEHEEAARAAHAFGLLEAGLARSLGPDVQSDRGSSSRARELTQ